MWSGHVLAPIEGDSEGGSGDVARLIAGPDGPEPGAGSSDRQLPLLKGVPVSVVPYQELRELAMAQVRRECRRLGFDWKAFVAEGPEWGITEVVHRRAVRRAQERRLDCRPTDIPTDTVLSAVRGVIGEWDQEPALRPCEADFREEQARRGERGRETQRALAMRRGVQVMELVASGLENNAEIGRRVGVDRSTVMRIRRKREASPRGLEDGAGQAPAFPAPELPASER